MPGTMTQEQIDYLKSNITDPTDRQRVADALTADALTADANKPSSSSQKETDEFLLNALPGAEEEGELVEELKESTIAKNETVGLEYPDVDSYAALFEKLVDILPESTNENIVEDFKNWVEKRYEEFAKRETNEININNVEKYLRSKKTDEVTIENLKNKVNELNEKLVGERDFNLTVTRELADLEVVFRINYKDMTGSIEVISQEASYYRTYEFDDANSIDIFNDRKAAITTLRDILKGERSSDKGDKQTLATLTKSQLKTIETQFKILEAEEHCSTQVTPIGSANTEEVKNNIANSVALENLDNISIELNQTSDVSSIIAGETSIRVSKQDSNLELNIIKENGSYFYELKDQTGSAKFELENDIEDALNAHFDNPENPFPNELMEIVRCLSETTDNCFSDVFNKNTGNDLVEKMYLHGKIYRLYGDLTNCNMQFEDVADGFICDIHLVNSTVEFVGRSKEIKISGRKNDIQIKNPDASNMLVDLDIVKSEIHGNISNCTFKGRMPGCNALKLNMDGMKFHEDCGATEEEVKDYIRQNLKRLKFNKDQAPELLKAKDVSIPISSSELAKLLKESNKVHSFENIRKIVEQTSDERLQTFNDLQLHSSDVHYFVVRKPKEPVGVLIARGDEELKRHKKGHDFIYVKKVKFDDKDKPILGEFDVSKFKRFTDNSKVADLVTQLAFSKVKDIDSKIDESEASIEAMSVSGD